MNEEEILTEVYWSLSTLDGDQIKYPDYDTLIKQLKKYMNSRYGTIIAKEGKMAGFLNEQVQEWYEKNKDLLSVIDKLTKRCEKLEEENNYNKKRLEEKDITIKNLSWKADGLRHDKELLKNEFDIKVKVVKELNDRLESLDRNFRLSKSTITYLNGCLAEKKARNRELKQKLDAITDSSNVALNSIFTSLGVNDTRSALDKIMEMKKLIKHNEEEKQNLKDEVKTAVSREEVAKQNLTYRTHEITDLNNCLAKKNARIKELKQKLTAITNVNSLDFNAIFTSLGVNDTRSALDKIMEMKKTIKQNEDDLYLMDRNRKADAKNHEKIQIAYDNLVDRYEELQASYDILEKKLEATSNANVALDKKNTDLQEAYDNCVNECTDYINEINSLLQNLEVKTVEQGIEAIKALKDGWMIKFDFSAEADLRMENEKLKKKVEDLKKDVKFEFDHRMAVLAASVDQDTKIAELKETIEELRQKDEDLCRVLQEESIGRKRAESENAKLKSFIKDRTKEIHEVSEEIEKRLAKYRDKYREEKNHE